jgi:outer membrane lipoprotein-sorting protein
LNRAPVTFVTAALLCLAAGHPAATQSVDQIIQKNLDAKGGLTRLKQVNTIKQTATMSMQGRDASITIYSKRPNFIRQEIHADGRQVVNGFDGYSPWILNPNVSPKPIVLTGPQADQIKAESNFDGPLVDFKAQGSTVAMNGFEMMGSRRVVHLRLTTAGGQRSDVYLDAETWLETRISTQQNQPNQPTQLRRDQELSDYRDQDGIKVPFLVRTLMNGVLQSELKVQTVEFNVTLDDALFKVPKG